MEKIFKGTKGGWKYSKADNKNNVFYIDNDEKHVSFVYFISGKTMLNYPREEEARANAQLIASSPELLECLQHILELASQKCTSTMEEALFLEEWDEWTEKAKSVINKALG